MVFRPGPRRLIARRPWRPWWRPWWWYAPAPTAPILPLATAPLAASQAYNPVDGWWAWGCILFWVLVVVLLIILGAQGRGAAVVYTYSYSYGVG